LQLLVSVKSAVEVRPALNGGADIVDAKEPARGALGAVSAETLSEIVNQVPPTRAFSIALGDFRTVDAVEAAVASVQLPQRAAPSFLKLGFAGTRLPARVGELLNAAVQAASRLISPPAVVAVGYGDSERADSISPDLLLTLAQQAGAAGVLLDTYVKDGRGLLDWWKPIDLAAWVSEARGRRLMTALAGSLSVGDVYDVCRLEPDVIGFRGAACDGGRSGQVSAQRVRQLREHMELEPPEMGRRAYAAKADRETQDYAPYPGVTTSRKSRKNNN
jgi:(5-formylfuran-3-yl)methyl phosphate synthase